MDFERQRLILRDTKNGETRAVPIKGAALDALRQHSRVRLMQSDLVFPSLLKPTQPTGLKDAWEKARARADLPGFRFHDLRHTAASYLVMSGASLLEIAAILGHKTLQMVKRYSHLCESHTAGVVERMNKAMLS